jgi:DNA-binding response OmpR family regulator
MERHAPRLDDLTEQVARPVRVVVAHGNLAYLAALQERLQQHGCSVHVAHSGEQARMLARRIHADIVVLDSEMPFESGWLTAEKLRRERQNARAIVVTPEATFTDRRFAEFICAAAIVDGAEGPEAVLERIDEIMKRTRCNAWA